MLRSEHQGDSEWWPFSQKGDPEEASEWQDLCSVPGPSLRLTVFISDLGEDLENGEDQSSVSQPSKRYILIWLRHGRDMKKYWFRILPLPTY